ncbi:MAG: cobalamin-dependent protein [Eubacteriales bacterium]|nr:cobalamin-dependent protein [Eubacteriales bacterium]
MLQNDLLDAVSSLDEARSMSIAKALLNQGCSLEEIMKILGEGVRIVGDKFAAGEFFIGDLIVSGMLYRSIISLFSGSVSAPVGKPLGRIVCGVGEDDIHDIGKDIIVSLLRAEGFEVIDLGVDVKPCRFVYAVETYKPDLLVMSGLMNCTLQCMKTVVQMLTERGLRDQVAIIVGGNAVNKDTLQYIQADAVSIAPVDALTYCKQIVMEEKTQQ